MSSAAEPTYLAGLRRAEVVRRVGRATAEEQQGVATQQAGVSDEEHEVLLVVGTHAVVHPLRAHAGGRDESVGAARCSTLLSGTSGGTPGSGDPSS